MKKADIGNKLVDAKEAVPAAGVARAKPQSADDEWGETTKTDNLKVAKPAAQRKVIQTAALSVVVDSVDRASREIEALCAAGGGYISNSLVQQAGDGGAKFGTIVLRVPQGAFNGIIGKIEGLGTVMKKDLKGEDVTQEYTDIESRLRNLNREEAQFLEIMTKAKKIDDILKVENELGRVRGEIEQLVGRKKYLDNMVELATITVEISEKSVVVVVQPKQWDFSDTIKSASKAFLATLSGLIKTLIWTGIFFPFVLVPVMIIYFLSRISKRRRTRTNKEADGS